MLRRKRPCYFELSMLQLRSMAAGAFSTALHISDNRLQLVEGLDDRAIDIDEDSTWVIENRLKSRTTRTDYICKIVIPHIDCFVRGKVGALQCMFEDARLRLIDIHVSTWQRKIEER